MTALAIDVEEGERLRIQPRDGQPAVFVILERKSGRRARLRIEADEGVRIERATRSPTKESDIDG